jgi:hypothetical protein
MLPLALALHLAAAAPGPSLVPMLDPGPFQGGEIAASSLGVVAGDALVVGAGFLTLQLFANGTLFPSASNFRRAAYATGVSSLVVPPLTAALLARWARTNPASGSLWKALLLATAGQAIALGAGYLAAPRFWVILPVQLVTVAVGTTIGLHWGPRARAPEAEARRGAPDAPGARPSRARLAAAGVSGPLPMCPVD